jgi:hypothetical protein
MTKPKSPDSPDSISIPTAPRSNSAVVREILDSGVTKPAEIVRIALEKYQLKISPGLINAAKMAWRKKQGGAALKRSRAPRKAPTVTPLGGEMPNGRPESKGADNGWSVGSSSRPSELEVAKFALKMGGIDAAIAALQDLVK